MKKINIIFLAGVLFAFIACGQSDTATVTIDVGGVQGVGSGRASLFDRVLAMLSLAGKAGAQGGPGDVDFIFVMVTGPGMAAIEENIPVETGTVTIDVPSGSGRTFTVVAYNDIGDGVVFRMYGGIATRDLAPASSVAIGIEMGLLPGWDGPGWYDIFQLDRSYDQQENPFNYIRWWTEGQPPELLGFHLYRARGDLRVVGPGATPDDGAFGRIASFIIYDPQDPPVDYTDYAITDEHVYWYRLSGYNQYGEGYLTDPFPDYVD